MHVPPPSRSWPFSSRLRDCVAVVGFALVLVGPLTAQSDNSESFILDTRFKATNVSQFSSTPGTVIDYSRFFGTTWNVSSGEIGGYTTGLFGEKYGASLSAQTNGKIGFDVTFRANSGLIDLDLPNRVTVNVPGGAQDQPTLTIQQDRSAIGTGDFYKTTFPQIQLGVEATFKVNASATANVAFGVGEVGGTISLTDLYKASNPYVGLAMAASEQLGHPFNPFDNTLQLLSYNTPNYNGKLQLLGLPPKDLAGTEGLTIPISSTDLVKVKKIPVQTTLGVVTINPPALSVKSGANLSAAGDQPIVLAVGADIPGMIATALGMPFNPLELRIGLGSTGLEFNATLLSADTNLGLGLRQSTNLKPNTYLGLQSNYAVTYGWTDSAGKAHTATTTDFQFLLDNSGAADSLTILTKPSQADWQLFPRIFVRPELENVLYMTADGYIDLTGMSVGVSKSGIGGSTPNLLDVHIPFTPTAAIPVYSTTVALNSPDLQKTFRFLTPLFGAGLASTFTDSPGADTTYADKSGLFSATAIQGNLFLSNALFANDKDLTLSGSLNLSNNSLAQFTRLTPTSTGAVTVQGGSIVRISGAKDSEDNFIIDQYGKKSVGFVDENGLLANGTFTLQGTLEYDGPDVTRIGANADITLLSSSGAATAPRFNNNGVDGLRKLSQIDGGLALAGIDLSLEQSLTNTGELIVAGGAILAVNGSFTNTGAGKVAIGNASALVATGAFANVNAGILSQIDLTLGDTTGGMLAYDGDAITALASTTSLTLSGTRPVVGGYLSHGSLADALLGLNSNAGKLVLQKGATQNVAGNFTNSGTFELKDAGTQFTVGGNFTDAAGSKTTLGRLSVLTVAGSLGNIVQSGGLDTLSDVDWTLAGPLGYNGAGIQAIGGNAKLTIDGANSGLLLSGGNAFTDLSLINGSLTLLGDATLTSNAIVAVNGSLTINGSGAVATIGGLTGSLGTIKVLAGTLDTSGGARNAAYWTADPTRSSLPLDNAGQLAFNQPVTMNGTLIHAGRLPTGIAAITDLTVNSTAALPFKTLDGNNGFAAIATIAGKLDTAANLRTDAALTVASGGTLNIRSGGELRVTGSTFSLSPGSTLLAEGTLGLGGAGIATSFTVPDNYIFNDGGTIELGAAQSVGSGSSQYYETTGSGQLIAAPGTSWTNSDNTILGVGAIMGGTFTNRGGITAAGGTLTLSGFDGPLVNSGTFASIGTAAHPGQLVLNSVTLQNSETTNAGSLVAGSVIAVNDSTVTGGSVSVLKGGTLELFNSTLTVDSLRIDGQMSVIDGATTNVTAPTTVSSSGTLVVYTGGTPATLAFGSGSSLLNEGTIALGGGTRITGVTLVNRGLVDITAGTAVNLPDIDNRSTGRVELRNGSTFNLGTASFANQGLIHLSPENPANVPHSTSTFLLTDDLTLTGGGTIQLGGYNYSIATLNGDGTTTVNAHTTWTNAGSGVVHSDNGARVLTLADHILIGQGELGQGTLSIDNQAGSVIAAADGGTLTIATNSGGIRNRGRLDVGADGTMLITGGPFLSLVNGALSEGSYRVGGTLSIPGLGTNFDTAVAILFTGANAKITNENGVAANIENILPTGSFTRLNGTTTFTSSFAAPFRNDGLLGAGNGDVDVSTPGNITITGGYFSNYDNNTLTGGRYEVAGTLAFEGADIITNAADITLRAGGQILDGIGQNGLRDFAFNTGSFRLFNGANYTAPAALFANSGTLQLDRSTFTGGTSLTSFSNGGALDMDFSVLKFGGNAGIFSNSGTTDLNHSTIEILGNVGVVNNTGTLHIHDGSNFSLKPGVGTFNQNGTVRVGPNAWLDFGDADVTNSGANYYIQGRVLGGSSFGGGATNLTLYGADAQWEVNGLPSPRLNTVHGTLTFAGGYVGTYSSLDMYAQRPINVGTWEIGSSHAIAPDGSTIRSRGSAIFTGQDPTDVIYFDNISTLRYYGGASDDNTTGQFKVDNARLLIDGGLLSSGIFDASGTIQLVNGGSLEVRSTLSNTEGELSFTGGGAIVIDGGLDLTHAVDLGGSILTFVPNAGRSIKLTGVELAGPGLDLGTTNVTPISLRNRSSLTNSTTGKSALANLTLNANTIELDDSGSLEFTGAFTNNGTMTVAHSSFLTFGSSLTNNGTMTGDGATLGGDFRMTGDLTNTGTLSGNVAVGGKLTNASDGVLDHAHGTVAGSFSNSGTLISSTFQVGTSVANHGTMETGPSSFTKIGGGTLTFVNDGTLTLNAGTYSDYVFSGIGGHFAVAPNSTVTLSTANPTLQEAHWSTGAGSTFIVSSDAVFGQAPAAISASAFPIVIGTDAAFSFSGPLAATRIVRTNAGATIFGATTDASVPRIEGLGNLALRGDLTVGVLSLASTATLDVGGHLTLENGVIFGQTVIGGAEIFFPSNKNLEFQQGASMSGTIHNPVDGGLFVGGTTFVPNVDNLGAMTFKGGQPITYEGEISGAGTLRLILNTALTLTRANTISGGTTIDAGSSLTLTQNGSVTGNIVNNGNVTYAYDDEPVFTVPSNVTGTGSLTQAGHNSFLVIPNLGVAGGLTIAHADSGVVFGTGGALSGTITAPIVNQGLLWFNHTGAINVTGNISGSSDLSLIGAGTLTLTGAKTFTGKTSVGSETVPTQSASSGGGTLSIAGDSSLGAAPTSFVADQLRLHDGATLNLQSATTLAPTRGLTTDGTVTISGASLTLTSPLGGSGTIAYRGNGTLTIGMSPFFGTHDFSLIDLSTLAFDNLGGTVDFASAITGGANSLVRFQGSGITRISAASATPFAGTTEIAAGSTLQFNGSLPNGTISKITNVLGTAEFSRVDDATLSGFTGTGTIVKNGANTVTITQPANDATAFRGSLVLNGGVLAMDNYLALGLEPPTFRADGLTFDGGTLRITGEFGGGTGANQGVTITTANGTIDLPGNASFDIAGPITGSGTLTTTGTGSLSLSGGGTFSSNIKISEGTLRSTSVTDQTFTGFISDDPTKHGAFWVDHAGGRGNVILTANNTYSGGTKVSGGVDLILGNGGNTGSVVGAIETGLLSNVRYHRSDSFTLPNTITGAGGLVQTGPGTLTIDSAQAYTGPTKVTGGTLRLIDGASFVGSLVIDATLELDYATDQTVANTISGTGGVTKSGTTTTTLSAANSYDGATKVDAGTLVLTGANTGTGGGAIASGATLEIADANGAAGGMFANAGTLALSRSGNYSLDLGTTGSGSIVKTGTGDAYLTRAADNANDISILAGNFGYNIAGTAVLSGEISGPGKLLKAGVGTLVLTQDNNAASGATITAGTLQLGNNTTTGFIAGPITVADGATLAYKRSNAIGLADNFSGDGAFAQLGTGLITITGDFTHTGGTTIGSGAALQIGNNGTAGSLAGNVANDGTLVFNRSDALTFAGDTTGTGTLQQSGAGTLTLTGQHTATGGAIIDSGRTLALGTSATLTGPIANSGNLTILTDPNAALDRELPVSVSGNGGVTIDGGGTLRIAGDLTYSGTTTIANASTLKLVNTTTSTLDNVITGSGNFVKLGAGTLILTADSNLSGTVTVGEGTLQLGNDGTTGSIGGSIATNTIDLQGGTLAIKHSDAITMANAISGGGGLAQLGSGRLTLTNDNIFTGVVRVGNGSELQLGAGGTTGSVVGHLDVDGLLQSTRLGDWSINLGLTGSGTISKPFVDANDVITIAGDTNHPVNFTGTVSYAGGTVVAASSGTLGTIAADHLRVTSGNNLTLVGANGALDTLNNGTLTIGNGGASGTFSGAITGGGTLAFNRSDAFAFDGSIASGMLHQRGSGTTTFNNSNHVFTGSVQIDAGNLVLNTLVGGTVINDGTLTLAYRRLDDGSTLTGTGKVVTASSGTTTLPSNTSYAGETEIAGGVLELSPNGGTTTLGGLVTGSGGLRVTSAGTVELGSGGTYTGATELTANPTLKVGGDLASNVSGTGTLEFDPTTGPTVSSNISGAIAVTKTGPGTLTLTGANTHTGETRIEAGTVRAGGGMAFSGNSSLFLANTFNALLDLANFDTLVLMLTGGGPDGGNIDLGSGRLTVSPHTTFGTPLDGTYAGRISGSGGLTMDGNGTLTLTGTNDYTGGTSILQGTLAVAGNNALGLGTVLLNGGTLRVDGNTTFGATRPIQTGAADGTLVVSNGITATIDSPITGAGSLFKDGAGAVLLNATPTNSGLVQINGGSLALGTGTLSSSQLLINGGYLDLNGHTWSTPLNIYAGGVANSSASNALVSGQLDTQGTLALQSTGGDLRVTGALTSTSGAVHLTTDGTGRVAIGSTPAGTLGRIDVNSGTLAIENTAALSALDGFVISNRGQVELAGGSTTLALDYLVFNGGALTGDLGGLQNTLGGSTIRVEASPTTFAGLQFNGLGSVLLGGAGNLTLAGRAGGTADIAKIGAGRLTLEGNYADWLGGFDVRAGTLAVDSALLQDRALNLRSGGSLDLGSASNLSLGALTGDGTLALGSTNLTLHADSTFGGTITGSGTVTKNGAGVTSLSNLSVAALVATNGETNVTGTVASSTLLQVEAGATLRVEAASVTTDGGTTFTGKVNTDSLFTLLNQTVDLTANAGSITLRSGGSFNDDAFTHGTLNTIASNTGTLRAEANASLSVAGTFVNNGTVSVATNGGLSAGVGSTTSITQAGGSLTIESNASVTVRTLNVTGGTTTFDGALYNFSGGSPTLALTGGTLTGSGRINGRLTLSGGTFSPGHSPGQMTATTSTWNPGGEFRFELNALPGSGTAGTNWDLLAISNALTLAATTANPFTIDLVTLTSANTAGLLDGFDFTQNYTWSFVTAGSIANFDANAFAINTTAFANAFQGTFTIASTGTGLDLVYTYGTSAIPEPSSYAALLGVGALGLGLWRRRRSRISNPSGSRCGAQGSACPR